MFPNHRIFDGNNPGRWWQGLREPAVLLVLAATAASLLAFAKLADEVAERETGRFDRAILAAFRAPDDLARPIGPSWLQPVLVDVTSLGSGTVLALLATLVVGYLFVAGRRLAALTVLVSVAGGAALDLILKIGFGRPRPDLVPHLVAVSSYSFPSGHAMLSAVTYLTLGALLARFESRGSVRLYLMTSAIFLTLIVGASRVYLGVHWPTDVLGGWAAGAAWALLCWLGATYGIGGRPGHIAAKPQ
jgi:undecaprenyl-diphosphatase